MVEIIKMQGERCILPGILKPGRYKYHLISKKSGKITRIDNSSISKIARIAGAPADKKAGIFLYKHKSDKIKKGEKIFTIYAESRQKLEFAVEIMKEINGVKIE